MNIKLMITSMLLLISIGVHAQRPNWTYKTPKAENSSYTYRMETASGYNREDARNKAFIRMLQSVANALGVAYDSRDINDAVLNGKDFQTISLQTNIPINKVCEYTEKTSDGYQVYILCQVASKASIPPNYEVFSNCSSERAYSSGGALLRSVVVPSWGQFYGNHKVNGGIIIAGTVLTGATALVANSKANGFYDDATNAVNLLEKQSLLDDYNKWNDNKTYSFIGLGVV